MNKTILQFVVLFIVLTLLQVVCNKIILFGVATPIIFIYTLFRLPVNLAKSWVFTIAFFLGLIIDIFGNTAGMNALSCTVASAFRIPVFNLYVTREEEMSTPIPSSNTLGFRGYLKYCATMTTIYCAILFLVQSFSFNNFLETAERMVASSVLSIILILGIDSLISTRREKRL